MTDLKSREIELAWALPQARYVEGRDRYIPGLLESLAEAQNWRCCYCGVRMDAPPAKGRRRATFEHIIPRSSGGSDRRVNLVIACERCNYARGKLLLAQHLEVMAMFPNGELFKETNNA